MQVTISRPIRNRVHLSNGCQLIDICTQKQNRSPKQENVSTVICKPPSIPIEDFWRGLVTLQIRQDVNRRVRWARLRPHVVQGFPTGGPISAGGQKNNVKDRFLYDVIMMLTFPER